VVRQFLLLHVRGMHNFVAIKKGLVKTNPSTLARKWELLFLFLFLLPFLGGLDDFFCDILGAG